MVKLNRIGVKLGLAGLVGLVLSGSLIATQFFAEAAITDANLRADRQQAVASNALEANVGLRRMQLAVRDIRLAEAPAEVDNAAKVMKEAQDDAFGKLDAAVGLVVKPENRERLLRIKALTSDYGQFSLEIAAFQNKIFALIKKRQEFTALFNSTMQSLATNAENLSNRNEVQTALEKTRSQFADIRAAVLRLQATGEDAQRAVIASGAAAFKQSMPALKALIGEAGNVDALAGSVQSFVTANDEVVKNQDAKRDHVANRALPAGIQAVELMRVAVDTATGNAGTSRADAANDLSQANRRIMTLALVVMASIAGSILFTILGVARPLTRLNGALGKMASGELGVDIPGSSRGDEVGDIAKTVVVISGNAERKARDEAELKILQDNDAAERRKRDMIKLADDFEGAVGEIVETVSSAATELEASASSLTATADRSQELTTMVAAASEEASTNVQSVASATEEMASSVNEISRQVQESARIASEAVLQAGQTNERIAQLASAASRIGDVVDLINTIAGQTNLLALNATIEAARAGEAGRGFAVVASEVKTLAEQTAKATGDISQQISGMQAATQESVAAIRDIGLTIGQMSEISSTIASAVEEQGAATQEISRNVQQAAQGTLQVSSNIGDVQRGASETGSASSQVLSAAQSLSVESSRLKAEVNRFLDSVRAA